MNVAFGAFILTLFFIPAISLRLAFHRQRRLKELLHTMSVTDSMWLFIIAPVITHIVLLITIHLAGYEVKYELILEIIYGNKGNHCNGNDLAWDVMQFLVYNLIAFSLSFFACSWLINSTRIGRYVAYSLGANNELYDLLNASYTPGVYEVIQLDILTATKEAVIEYSGFLENYYFQSKSTELSYLLLVNVKSRLFPKTPFETVNTNPQNQPQQIEHANGSHMLIPVKEILNITITYLTVHIPNNTAP